jgi:hypothetical protein
MTDLRFIPKPVLVHDLDLVASFPGGFSDTYPVLGVNYSRELGELWCQSQIAVGRSVQESGLL